MPQVLIAAVTLLQYCCNLQQDLTLKAELSGLQVPEDEPFFAEDSTDILTGQNFKDIGHVSGVSGCPTIQS